MSTSMYYHKEMSVVKRGKEMGKWVNEIKCGKFTEVVGSRTNQNDLKAPKSDQNHFL